MINISLDINRTLEFVSKKQINAFQGKIISGHHQLLDKAGKGNDFMGWVDLPSSISNEFLDEIKADADRLSAKAEVFVVIGIGGSYLGSRAVIEALQHQFSSLVNTGRPKIVYAGQNISEDYMADLIDVLDKYEYAVTVISKSGTTTEPALAFRIIKNHLEAKVGKAAAKNLIVAITDEKKGALRKMADDEGYKTFVIPDNVGGRFSVLTPVGLLPIACAGFDIKNFVEGARSMEKLCGIETPFEENPAAVYAAVRNALYRKGKKVEILANFNHKLNYISEWWKQLYGESEGKENKGIFPASVNFTADLHSMGQYIQEGERHIFETVVSVEKTNYNIAVPFDTENLDGLNFLSYKRIDEVNKMAELGTLIAHVDGGVPNLQISLPEINEFYIGQLLYFFEKACGISGYILDVNPFDQPGVEAYKKNMFALLEKPGFEAETKKLKNRLGL